MKQKVVLDVSHYTSITLTIIIELQACGMVCYPTISFSLKILDNIYISIMYTKRLMDS